MSTHIATETKRRYGSLIALSRARSRNRPLQLGRMSAELGSQRFDLPAGEVERAGAVDFLRCMPKFLLEGKLRGDAAKSVFAAHAPLFEALELLLGTAPDNHEAVELLVISGFDQESGFNENRIADAFALPFVHFTMKGLFDAGMNDDVQASQLGGIRKHLGAKLAAVDAAPCAEDSRTKFAEDFVIRGLARLNEVMRQAVRVDHAEAQFAKDGGDSTLAARDAPGKAYAEHAQLMGGCGGLRGERFAASAAKTRGLHRIAHQHGDRHRTNAAGNRCEGAGDLDGVGMDVADEDGSLARNFSRRAGKSRRRCPASRGSVTLLVPTSTTVAPGRIQSAATKPGLPMAATMMSARRRTSGRARVLEWQMVTVALACMRRRAMGFPTMSLRPRTTALAPSIVIPLRRRISMQPAGVQATRPGRPLTRRPRLTGWNPSTSFAGSTASSTRLVST